MLQSILSKDLLLESSAIYFELKSINIIPSFIPWVYIGSKCYFIFM